MPYREIVFVTDEVLLFYQKQQPKIQRKIDFVFDLIRNVEIVPIQYLKYLKGSSGIYEIRVLTHVNSIRFLCFFEKNQLIVVTNSFVKKTHKTPSKQIQIAENIKKEYENK